MEQITAQEYEKNKLKALLSLSDPKTIESIISGLDKAAAAEVLKDLEAMREAVKSEVIKTFADKDSGNNFINDSPVTKELLKRSGGASEPCNIILGTNSETGEAAIFTLLDGYLTPYEKEIVESASKFLIDGQTTETGKIYFTIGQLYRSMRHGSGTQSPTPAQREALNKALAGLERKITFKMNDYLSIWGGFETNGGKVRILGYDEFFGKIRGQEDTLIVLDETPIICAIAQNLRMCEIIPQEIKAIKQKRFAITYKAGDKEKKRSFASNEERRSFCQKNGITRKDIINFSDDLQPFSLTENRIALRSVIFSFVFSYLRARTVNKPHSAKLTYKAIFERCSISETTENRKQIKRSKEDIAVIMEHLKNCEVITSWSEYSNTGSTKPDGIQITISKNIEAV